MRHCSLRTLGLAAVFLCACAATSAQVESVDVRINPAHPGARISPDVFGQFAEHLGTGIYGGIWVGKDSPIPNVRGIRSDVVAALRALKVPNVRWPGGCFADEYHWRDGIGPAASRKSTVNTNWGGALEPNSFGTDEFMDFIDQIGSDAYLSINVGSGSVREAAAWMEYMTAAASSTAGQERAANGHPQPYRVKFLGLGNESWGCGGSFSPDYYVNQMRAYARFVHNFNPAQTGELAMRRIAVGADGNKTDYIESVMKAWHEKVWAWDIEGVSLHSYTSAGWPPAHPSTHFGEDEYALLLADTLHMEDLISAHSSLMDRYDPEKKVTLAVDEWGVWLAPLPGTNPGFLVQQNSLRDAILAAPEHQYLRPSRRPGAHGQHRADAERTAGHDHHRRSAHASDTDLSRVPHVRSLSGREPAAHQLHRALHFRADQPAQTRCHCGPPANGHVALSLVNLDPAHPLTLHVRLNGLQIHTAQAQALTAQSVDAINSFDEPNAVVVKPLASQTAGGVLSLTLPAKSVAVVDLQ